MNLQAHEVARKTLNLEDVRKALVALPPPATQNSIVREADALLSRAEATERDVAIAEARVEALRHAVLADAFSARQTQAQS